MKGYLYGVRSWGLEPFMTKLSIEKSYALLAEGRSGEVRQITLQAELPHHVGPHACGNRLGNRTLRIKEKSGHDP